MSSQILVKRYAEGLINSAQDKQEFSLLCRQLRDVHRLISTQKDLKNAFTSPFLPTAKKMDIAEKVLVKIPLERKAQRFILLLVENNRLNLFHEILEQLPLLWNEQKGIATFEVRSVVPLNTDQKRKLEDTLSRIQQSPVSLTYTIDPDLLGGLSVRKENVIYDISLQGDLERLKQKIIQG